MNNIGERLQSVLEASGLTDIAFAKTLHVTRDTISRWIARKAAPKAKNMQLLAQKYGTNIHWLVTGQGPMKIEHDTSRSLNSEDYFLIPMIESRVTGGPEGELIYDGIADYYPFKELWLDKLVGRNAERRQTLFLTRVSGQSMCPTINHGEAILVDSSEPERLNIRTGQIYLVILPGGEIAVKRLAISFGEDSCKLICMSDNIAAYQPFEFAIEPGRRLKNYVLGRVRWCGKEFD